MNLTTYILIFIILILGISILFICKGKDIKSTFGANSESTSIKPNISNDSVLIFYAPWCGHCKNSMGIFEKAVASGQGKVVLIDSTDPTNKDIVKKYENEIKGFPTIIKGDKTKFTGKRTEDDIVEFLKKK